MTGDDQRLRYEVGRYSRQSLFWGIGEAGQRKLGESRAVVVGCGALGCAIVDFLARAGAGNIVIVDRDFVELSNLQRQILFDEADAATGAPKALAAARAVARINSAVEVHPLITDLTSGNVMDIIAGAHVVLDGTDNLETRYLVNDACIKTGTPWIYGGALADNGMTMTILPHETPCLRCIFPEKPPAGSMATCETAGVLVSTVALVAAIQWTEAVKILTGNRDVVNRGLITLDPWRHDYRIIELTVPDPRCPCCGEGRYEYLEAQATSTTTSMCGRNAVQVSPAVPQRLALQELAGRLGAAGLVTANEYLVRLRIDEFELSIFSDGRAIIKGTTDEAVARCLYARYVGI